MGTFDTIILKCPECKETFEEQSKAGECILDTYTEKDAPLCIISDINKYSKRGMLFCPNCSVRLHLRVFFSTKLEIVNMNKKGVRDE